MKLVLPMFLGAIMVLACNPGTPVMHVPPQAPAAAPQDPKAVLPPLDIYFSPKGGCTDAIVAEIGKASATLLVQAYELTSKPIGKALLDAKARGVEVKVLVDRSQETANTHSQAPSLVAAGAPVKTDDKHRIAHNKVIVIDGKTLLTGSFNFTPEAESDHAENLLIIRDPGIAKRYADNWAVHEAHCRAYAKQ